MLMTKANLPMLDIKYRANTTEIESFEGYEGMILKILSTVMNFTIDLIDCKQVWGSVQPNNSWELLVKSTTG